ncbi:hypothetical protein [Kitasatospora sp. NPDC094015]|uniref:hypothetical protein n=1 Tax=Kitasatospora sp. NPDC094015 TaxID=3155205 RepID=UPI00331C16F3
MDFETVADELYGLPPTGFTAARDAAVRQAGAEGDRALAGRLGGLRRPTRGAWLANLLVRAHPAEIGPLLELGEGLREAQRGRTGTRLRELSERRRELVDALTRQAEEAAAADGLPAGEPALRDLEQTLRAVLADPRAADAFAAGRLTTGLDDAAALPAATAATGPHPGPARTRERRTTAKDRTTAKAAREAAAQQASQRAAVKTAEKAAARAAAELERRTARYEDAVARAERTAEALARAEQTHRRAEQARADRAAELADARSNAEQAAGALRELRGGR